MRVRKSGLGGHFCQLSNGKTLRLASCVDCGSLLLKFKPWWLQRDKESLNELYDDGVHDWSGSTYGRDELICTECVKEIDRGGNYSACTVSPLDFFEGNVLVLRIEVPNRATTPERCEFFGVVADVVKKYFDEVWHILT